MRAFPFVLLVLASTAAAGGAAEFPFDPGRIAQHVASARAGLPIDSGEFLIDTTPTGYTVMSRGGPAGYPAVAFGGGIYLVCWKTLVGSDTLFAARVSASGVLLDTEALLIGATSSTGRVCAVAYGDSVFLIAWEHSGYSIRAARVSLAGQVLDPGGFELSRTGRYRQEPALAFNGTAFLVGWRSYENYVATIRGCLVLPDGSIVNPQDIELVPRTSWLHDHVHPSIASSGNEFLLTWTSTMTGDTTVWAKRVDGEGVVIDTTPIPLCREGHDGKEATVAFGSGSYLVAWRRAAEGLADIVGARILSDGTVIDRDPFVICVEPGAQMMPRIAFSRGLHYVTWQDSRNGYNDVYAARVTPSGLVLDPQGIPVCTADSGQEVPAIACAGDSGGMVAWLDLRVRQNGPVIHAVRVDSLGRPTGPEIQPGGGLNLTRTYAKQNYPAVAFDGQNYLVVWEDERAGANNRDVYGALLTASGQLLEPGVFPVAVATNLQQAPAVAFGDSVYLVVWEDTRVPYNNYDIYGTRVTRAGRVLDPGGIPIMYQYNYSQRVPAVAFDGANFLIAWQTDGVAALQGKFVNAAGQMLDSSPRSVPSPADAGHPTMAFGDSAYLAAWESKYAARISRLGGRLDTTLLEFGNGALPEMAFDGTNYCIVWQASQARFIYATRVSQAGIVLDPGGVYVSSADGRRGNADIEYGVDNYLSIWEDARGGDIDILGAWMDPSLVRMETLSVSRRPGNQYQPAVAKGNGNQLLVVFSCTTTVVNSQPASGNHIWGRFLADPGLMPPGTLWPPENYHFTRSPAWVLADTTVRADSFGFRVYTTAGDTIWRCVGVAPCCTIPESVLTTGSEYWWQVRVRTEHGWSRYGTASRFWVNFEPTGLQEHFAVSVPDLRIPSVVSRRLQSLPIQVTNAGSPIRLQVFASDGRRALDGLLISVGRVSLAMRVSDGRTLPAGVYVLRAQVDGCAFERKFVVVE